MVLTSGENLSNSSYWNYNSNLGEYVLYDSDRKITLNMKLNTEMKIFAFLFKENYSMSELFSGVREVGYYGESRSFSINTNTNSLSLGITLKAASGNEDDSTGTGAGTGDTTHRLPASPQPPLPTPAMPLYRAQRPARPTWSKPLSRSVILPASRGLRTASRTVLPSALPLPTPTWRPQDLWTVPTKFMQWTQQETSQASPLTV